MLQQVLFKNFYILFHSLYVSLLPIFHSHCWLKSISTAWCFHHRASGTVFSAWWIYSNSDLFYSTILSVTWEMCLGIHAWFMLIKCCTSTNTKPRGGLLLQPSVAMFTFLNLINKSKNILTKFFKKLNNLQHAILHLTLCF